MEKEATEKTETLILVFRFRLWTAVCNEGFADLELVRYFERMLLDQQQPILSRSGWEITGSGLENSTLEALRSSIFCDERAGQRCLLDVPLVVDVARKIKHRLQRSGHLSSAACAIQAISFDKSPTTNWMVSWHQDLMFPFASAVTTFGYDLSTPKDGIPYARPPVAVLESMLAVRLHLDVCDGNNGPLRVSPGTHRLGIIPQKKIAQTVDESGEQACLAAEGEVLLMKPLILHASSKAAIPQRRRVVHLVYYVGPQLSESWHRSV